MLAGLMQSFIPRAALLVALTVTVAGCSRDEPEIQATNASIEEVAEQVREASAEDQFIRPGKWISQVRFEEMSAPGVPEATQQQVNELLSEGKTFENCLTDEQAKRPGEGFFTGADGQCRYQSFTMGGGKIDATMRCAQGGATQITRMVGSYSPDSYQLKMTSSVEGLGEVADAARLSMRIDAKRVGKCEAPAADR